jgi:radical SAM-linked protein
MLRLRFARQEPAVWLAHLDLMRTFERSIRRAGLPVTYSQGYNPRPHLMFALPIGTGLATCDDYIDVSLASPVEPRLAVDLLNRCLPEGLSVLAAAPIEPEKSSLMSRIGAADYEIAGSGVAAAAARLLALPDDRPWLVQKGGKQAGEMLDVRPLVLGWLVLEKDRVVVRVRAGSRENLRPDLLLAALVQYADLDPIDAADAAVTRLRLLVPTPEGNWQSPLPLPDER